MVKRTAESLIVTRNEFYENSYNTIKKIVTLLLLICILLIGFALYQNRAIELAPKYFPTTPDGQLIISPPFSENHLLLSKQKVGANGVIVGMPQPTISYAQLQTDGEDALVLYWARLAVENMFDYDYIHYRSVIENARMYFTPQGHENFIQALLDSKNLETVKARSAVIIPQINGDVTLLGTHMYFEHYAWDIEVPIKLTYESAANPIPLIQNLLAKMSIARVSTLTFPFYGLSIYKLNFEQTFEQQQANT